MLRAAGVLRAVMKGDWFTSIDLKDAYFHITIVSHHQKFLSFSFKNQAYQFKVLPFGLSLVPRVFTRCTTAALYPLWSRGIQILPYLDDWMLCAPSKEQAVHGTTLLLEHVQKLGLSVNKAKSCLVLMQTITYIGMLLDSRLMSATLSRARADNVLQLIAHIRLGVSLQYRVLLQLLGMFGWDVPTLKVTSVIPLCLLHLRPL